MPLLCYHFVVILTKPVIIVTQQVRQALGTGCPRLAAAERWWPARPPAGTRDKRYQTAPETEKSALLRQNRTQRNKPIRGAETVSFRARAHLKPTFRLRFDDRFVYVSFRLRLRLRLRFVSLRGFDYCCHCCCCF